MPPDEIFPREAVDTVLAAIRQLSRCQATAIALRAIQDLRAGLGICDVSRFWLDPQQDDIVKRADMLMVGANVDETLHASHEVEVTARSATGIGYATKIRLKNVVGTASGQPYDQLYLIDVDLDAKLSGALFGIPRVGQGSQKIN